MCNAIRYNAVLQVSCKFDKPAQKSLLGDEVNEFIWY